MFVFHFFFNDTATTEIYTLSLHDALPISGSPRGGHPSGCRGHRGGPERPVGTTGEYRWHVRRGRLRGEDRKSTRLNSSHANISYAVFCLKKKNKRSLAEPARSLQNYLASN